MIERFYDPLAGQILLDGKLINEFNIQEYRKQIALVSQEPVSTVYWNAFHDKLSYFRPDVVCGHCPFQRFAWGDET